MTPKRRKQILIAGAAVLVLAFIAYGFLPDPVMVQTAQVTRDRLEVAVEEEGVTRVVDRYTISAPSAAWMRRLTLEPGDSVVRGQVLVQLEPPRSGQLDPRSQEQAEARLESVSASLERARRGLEAADATARQAERELERINGLAELGSATTQMQERVETEAISAQANRASAAAALTSAQAELRAAEAVLRVDDDDTLDSAVVIRAPAAGTVLAVHRQSASMVSPGTPLLEIGDTATLEVQADVLSRDAVLIVPGTQVHFDQWGGEGLLEGIVQRVEPQGFTSISSLGVEEQRVNVIARITSALQDRERLGSGYRVLARFIVWEGDDVLQVPSSALFRTESGWAVFVVENGQSLRRSVEIGQRTGLSAQVLSGLETGNTVVVHPGNAVADGVVVEIREVGG